MLRLVAFFFGVLVLLRILREIPLVGALFRIPLLGFWLAAILLSVLLSKLATDALDRRKRGALVRQLGAVDTPHNKGKLGTLFLSQGRAKRAIPLLEAAAAGEPESAEWAYRLGSAYLAARRPRQAIEALERALAMDEEHAYGAALMRLAEARAADGDLQGSLVTLERFERNHGPSPESAYRRGVALRASGRRDEARAAFGEVRELAHGAARYQRRSGSAWALRAFFARMG